MDTLAPGANGADVERLQRALNDKGFSPGAIDGDYGPGTQAAVLAFQRSQGLLADGVAGPRTLNALGLIDDPTPVSVLDRITPRLVSEMFPFTPIDNIKRNLPKVLDGLTVESLVDAPMALMALATIRAETESFVPVSEGRSRFNTSPGGKPFDLYDFRTDIGNHGAGDGKRYCGRGFVQLTGRDNYAKIGQRIGMGSKLVDNPDLANDSATAGRILASFIAVKERAAKEALVDRDYALARKLVNGGSHGVDRFTEAYLAGARLLAL